MGVLSKYLKNLLQRQGKLSKRGLGGGHITLVECTILFKLHGFKSGHFDDAKDTSKNDLND